MDGRTDKNNDDGVCLLNDGVDGWMDGQLSDLTNKWSDSGGKNGAALHDERHSRSD